MLLFALVEFHTHFGCTGTLVHCLDMEKNNKLFILCVCSHFFCCLSSDTKVGTLIFWGVFMGGGVWLNKKIFLFQL